MNNDISEGNWKQLKGKLREQWGKITDDEAEQAKGNSQQIAGMIQEKYGKTKEEALEAVNGMLEDLKGDDSSKADA